MLKLIVRGFVQRKLRVALTAVAIALGVALMAGTYILTDTINRSFASIFQTASKGHDVVITPTEALGRKVRAQTSPITEAMLAQVRATPGVAQAAGSIFTTGSLLDTHGKRLSGGHAPAFIASTVPARFESFKPVKGRFPLAPGETAIDEATAERKGLRIGEDVVVAGATATSRNTIVGIVQFGGGESFGGASVAMLTPAAAQAIVGEPGRYDQIDVAARPGVTPGELRDRIRRELPGTVAVRTGAEQAAKNTSDLESNLSFLRTFLLVFAYVALVVGAFIIFNTFSITVAQRTREFGLLRTLGGYRRQVLATVLYEGLMLGVVGAVLGLFAGIGLAPALDQLFKAIGADIPDNGTVLETRTIVVSLLVGISVTLLAGLPAALRATRVPPLAAMQEGVKLASPPLTGVRALVRSAIVAVVAFGLAALISPSLVPVAFIVLAVFVTVQLTRLARGGRPGRHPVVLVLARGLGGLVRWRGITGRLAEENSVRQPGRTMVTAAALTVGLALVALVAVLASGLKATIDQAVDRSFAGDLIVENSQNAREEGIPATVAPAVRAVPGVASATPMAFTVGRPRGSSGNVAIAAVEPASFLRAYHLEWDNGSNATLLGLGETGAVVTRSFATSEHLHVGGSLTLLTPTDRYVTLTVRGLISENAKLLGSVTITRQLARTAFGQREDALVFVSYVPGASNAQVQPRIDRMLSERFPQARSQTAAQFKAELANQVNTLLALVYVLLALSVIVSLFGIVNTLILSIYERTRELGMLRAIGTTRRQIRQMIRYESVITSLIGGVLGVAVGLVGGILVSTVALSGSGFVLSIPVGTLVILLIVAWIAGVLAAQLPARRAARIDVLQAIASE